MPPSKLEFKQPKMIERPDDLTEEDCQEAFAMFREQRNKVSNMRKNSSEEKAKNNGSNIKEVINFGIPHVGEQIFENLLDDDLIQCLKVSQTWRVLATNVMLKRWKGKMFEACKTGKTEIVKLLLKHFNSEESGLNVRDVRNRTSFTQACKNGHKDIVKLLLEHPEGNIDFNARHMLGQTGFILACKNVHKEVVKLLLYHSEGKIDLNARDNSGKTAFIRACEDRDTGVAQFLIKNAKTNSIEIPTNQSISELVEHWNYSKCKRLEKMRTLIEKFHQ